MNIVNLRALIYILMLLGILIPSGWSNEPTPTPNQVAQFVTVTGDVVNPGRVPWKPDMTLVDAIYSAGDIVWGSKYATIVRNNVRMRFNLKKLREDPASVPTLQAGDTIEVGGKAVFNANVQH